MSKPSFSNIDLWLFELAEGNLSPEQVKQLEMFLLQHPELDVERDVWEMAKVEKNPTVFPEMAALERTPNRARNYSVLALLLLLLIGSSATLWYLNNGQGSGRKDLQAIEKEYEAKDQELRDQIASLQEQLANKESANATGSQSVNDNSMESLVTPEMLHDLKLALRNGTNLPDWVDQMEDIYESLAGTDRQETMKDNQTGYSIAGVSSEELEQEVEEALAHIQEESLIYDEEDNHELDEAVIDYVDRGFVTPEVASKVTPRAPREVTEMSDFYSNGYSRGFQRTSASAGSGLRGKQSFKSKLKKFGRNLQRMMDNPVALKNSRDPHYLVPGMTSNDVNFSSAGTLIATRVQTMSRLQWYGQQNEQLMNQVAVDGYSYGMRGGWGIQLDHGMYSDGGLHVGQVALTYSPKISVSNAISVEPSVRFKMGNKRLNVDQMNGAEQIEVNRGTSLDLYPNGQTQIGKSLWYKDLGAGLLVNTKWFFAGVQVDNVFRYADNIYQSEFTRRAATNFVASAGTDWESRNEKIMLSPYLVYQNNDQLSELWAGVNMKWNWFTFGIAGSNKLDPAATIGMKFDRFSLSYQADYATSAMTNQRALSHQVMLRFVGKQNRFGKRLYK